MSALPEPRHALTTSIYRWWQDKADHGLRPHLGASLIGHPCVRYLWSTFRWAALPQWEGRMLRLFDRGQREEAVFVAELRGIGAEVSECQPDGQQWRVSACGGHFGGSLDGVARRLPGGSLTNWELLEFKTHNDASFKDLAKRGVEQSKHQHYCQMQTYLALTGMTRSNYFAVNKNTDAIYYERIHADAATGKAMLERAEQVIFAAEPPPPVSRDPSWYQCNGCTFHAFCHGTDAPLVTCRTCAHATPERAGHWQCERHSRAIDTAQQQAACPAHRYIPVLLDRFADLMDADQTANWVQYKHRETGALFTNTDPTDGYSSEEIHACQDKRLLGDPMVQAVRQTFDARVTV